jgi:hypothetical protein
VQLAHFLAIKMYSRTVTSGSESPLAGEAEASSLESRLKRLRLNLTQEQMAGVVEDKTLAGLSRTHWEFEHSSHISVPEPGLCYKF